MLILCVAMATAWADDVRGAVGGQFETQPHGILDLGYRRGPLTIAWQTDTLDVRLTDSSDIGRWSVGMRGAAFAAGMFITPWSDGAPDLQRAQQASYFGTDAEVQRYLPGGLWIGASGFVRPHFFRPLEGSTLDVPDTQWGRGQVHLGLWRDDGGIQARLTGGLDGTDPGGVSPHLFVEAMLDPQHHFWFRWGGNELAPYLELRAGIAADQTDVTATRIGGMTPYHVPVGGLAWAEVWAEDYAVGRLGARLSTGSVTTRLSADLGSWAVPEAATGTPAAPWALGLEGRVRYAPDAWFAEGAVGFSPTWARGDGVWPVPVYVLVGRSFDAP